MPANHDESRGSESHAAPATGSNEEARTVASAAGTWRVRGVVLAFAAGLIAVGTLRYLNLHSEVPPAIAANATLIYIGLTVAAAILLMRMGVPLRRLGFNKVDRPWLTLALVALGVVALQLSGWLLAPLWEQLFGSGRDLARFSDVAGSREALVKLLVLNWTVAALGEELAFRIVLMRGIAYALGDTRKALAIALVGQAVVFGIVHAYQGPAGIAGTMVSGLIFGGLTLAARWSIWPAAVAHGLNNTIGILEIYSAGS